MKISTNVAIAIATLALAGCASHVQSAPAGPESGAQSEASAAALARLRPSMEPVGVRQFKVGSRTRCDAPKDASAAKQRATEAVRQVPEIGSLTTSKLAIRADDMMMIYEDHCYWSVGVYEEPPKHPFAVGLFLVEASTGEILAFDDSGEFVNLERWRSSMANAK